ncbi:unnamed protein product [Pseudo-nitzschia multistriata]|uniref:Integral membrane bound transporter domain-containing protein n=1 Tax=Pseudo-nitzschia multistriata TaxID=183589 RepID=A0A448ZE15_9STRA|nr:unnamed protein product [Pseudo-nitzschia multistriata]
MSHNVTCYIVIFAFFRKQHEYATRQEVILPQATKHNEETMSCFLPAEHTEVTMRMGAVMFLGYAATFSQTISEAAIPIEQNIFLGIFVPFCTMLFPTLMFSFGTFILPFWSIFCSIQLLSTLLALIATELGNAAFVVAFCLVSFWVSFTRFDKVEGYKTSLIVIGIVIQTVLSFPNITHMQDGIRFFQSSTAPSGFPPLLEEQLSLLLESAIHEATNLGIGTHSIEINSSSSNNLSTSALEGRTAEISIYDDGSSLTYVEGGMWLVGAGWNISEGSYNLQNPFAKFAHTLALTLWITLIISLAVLMPPFRTMRSAVWREMIPEAMNDAARSIRLHAERLESGRQEEAGVEQSETKAEDRKQAKKMQSIARLGTRGKCVNHINAHFGGNLANYSVFEPRLLACNPPEWTTGTLVMLSKAVSKCVRIAVGIEILDETNSHDHRSKGQGGRWHKNMGCYLEVAEELELCGKALKIGDANLLKDLGQKAHDAESPTEESCDYYDPFHFREYIDGVITLSKRWLEQMDPRSSENYCSWQSLTAARKNGEPWIWMQFSHYVFFAKTLANLFRKSSWHALLNPSQHNTLPQVVWCAKFALGLTLLMVFLIYWPAYKTGFVVMMNEDDPFRSLFAQQNGGWAMIAYGFATPQTVEGSAKKGLLRMLGTVTGAFSAWLALIACANESFTFNYNNYAIVAWLTITSLLATFVGTERGFNARMGLSSDYGFGPIYFVVTQIIIVSYGYYLFDTAKPSDIAINRMIANLVGISMAIVVGLLPPGIWGGNPRHCRNIVRYHRCKISEAIELVASCPPSLGKEVAGKVAGELRDLSTEIENRSTEMQVIAADFEKDASRLRAMPRFQVDPRLKIEISKVTRDIYTAAFVPKLAASILEDAERRSALVGTESVYRRELLKLWEVGHDPSIESSAPIPNLPKATCDGDTDAELLVRAIAWLRDEFIQHETVLDSIKFGL